MVVYRILLGQKFLISRRLSVNLFMLGLTVVGCCTGFIQPCFKGGLPTFFRGRIGDHPTAYDTLPLRVSNNAVRSAVQTMG